MDKQFRILLSFLVLAAAGHMMRQEASASPREAAIVISTEQQSSQTTLPSRSTSLFAIHQQEEPGVTSASKLSDSVPYDYTKAYHAVSSPIESSFRREAAYYLFFFKTIAHSLSVKKLIFPFHTFL